MNFTELRNAVERVAGTVRHADDLNDDQAVPALLHALGDGIFVAGMCMVGMYQEIHEIRVALQDLDSKVIAAREEVD